MALSTIAQRRSTVFEIWHVDFQTEVGEGDVVAPSNPDVESRTEAEVPRQDSGL
jgi:hypothetical protein